MLAVLVNDSVRSHVINSVYGLMLINQLRLGSQRQVRVIPIADERVGVQVKL